MTAKTGRPVQGESKKTLRLQLRLNQEEMQMIDDCAEKLGANRTETVIKGVSLLKDELDKK